MFFSYQLIDRDYNLLISFMIRFKYLIALLCNKRYKIYIKNNYFLSRYLLIGKFLKILKDFFVLRNIKEFSWNLIEIP